MGWVISIVALVLFVGVCVAWSKRRRLQSRIGAVRQWPIREVAENVEARLVGRVDPLGEPLLSPLGGQPCVYYAVQVVRYRGLSGSNFEIDYPYVAEQRSVPFVLDDRTGRAIVDATHVRARIGHDIEHYTDGDPPPTANEVAFLARHGKRPRGWLFAKKLKFYESVIGIGERVAAVGITTREPDPDAPPAADYRGMPATRPRLGGTRQRPVLLTDDPALAPPHDVTADDILPSATDVASEE